VKPEALLRKLEDIVMDVAGTFIDGYFRIAMQYVAPIAFEMVTQNRLVYSEWVQLDIMESVISGFVTKDETMKVTKTFLAYYQALEKVRYVFT
jgi:hypothetical protein